MKTQTLIVLSVLLFCGTAMVHAQSTTNTLTGTNTVVYTLDIAGDKKIQGPTEAEIRAAVQSLDKEKNVLFVILEASTMTYIQAFGDSKEKFDLEYQEQDLQHHYGAKRLFSADEIVAIFVSYEKGQTDWKKLADWKPVK